MSENDTLYQQLRGHMSQLKLTASAEALAGHLDTAQKSKPSYTQFLAELLDIEVKAGEQRALASRLRLAGVPWQRTLEQFDFDAQASLDRRLIEELATTRFVAEKANVLFIDRPVSARQRSRWRSR
jgi:DNA replication protein DnaC